MFQPEGNQTLEWASFSGSISGGQIAWRASGCGAEFGGGDFCEIAPQVVV